MRRTNRILTILFALIAIYGAVLSALLLAWRMIGEQTIALILLVNAMPLVLLPAPLLLLLTLYWRRWLLIVLLLLPSGVLLSSDLTLFLPRPTADDPSGAFTVLSYNVRRANGDSSALDVLLREQNADIVTLLEVDQPVYAYVDQALRDLYPHQVAMPPSGDGAWQMILSRFPVTGAPINRVLYATLLVYDRPLRVFAVHLPRPTGEALSLTPRYRILDWVRSLAVADGVPTILMGDFNMSDRSDAHALLSQDFVDVWRVGGSGFGMTHPNWSVIAPPLGFLPALLRPDYIFVDPEIGILGAQVITAGRSDHFPVQARLTFVER